MHDDLAKILVEIEAEQGRKVRCSVPAALGMGRPKQIAAKGVHRDLAKKGPGNFGRESEKQDGAARAHAAQIR